MDIGSTLFSISMLVCIIGGILVGFVDSIAGGGGLISLPLLMAIGLPPHLAIGTNKFAATFGNAVSAIQFTKAGKIDLKLVKYMIPFGLLGAFCGCSLMVYLPEKILEPMLLLVLMATAALVIIKRDLGTKTVVCQPGKKRLIKAIIAAFLVGAYDGFAGPGAGTFMVVSFAMLGFDFVTAAGNAKVMAVVMNTTGLILLIYWQKILYVYAIALAISLMTGAYFGSRAAIRRGAGFIRIVMLTVTVLLIIKVVINYVNA